MSWWDGSTIQGSETLGWWDGSEIQQVETSGWWDGSAIQQIEILESTGYAEEVLADEPLLYWRLDEAVAVAISVATASSNYPGMGPDKAFDGNEGTTWTTNGTVGGWLQFAYTSPIIRNAYSIRRADDTGGLRNPSTWTFEGSNDALAWIVLDTRSGITWPTNAETKNFAFENDAAFYYYRLNVTANCGDAYLSIAEISTDVGAPESLTLLDSSGNSREGTSAGGSVSPAFSLLPSDAANAAISSAGQSTLRCPFASWMVVPQFTVEIWFSCPTLNGTQVLVSRQQVDGTSWMLRLDRNALVSYVWGSAWSMASTSPILPGQTYHTVFTYDSVKSRLYLDGVLKATSDDMVMNPSSASLRLFASGYGENLTGTLDEFSFYDHALSAERVAAHYAAAQ